MNSSNSSEKKGIQNNNYIKVLESRLGKLELIVAANNKIRAKSGSLNEIIEEEKDSGEPMKINKFYSQKQMNKNQILEVISES